ncbi:nuclease-related domain-containing protein [Mesobacillus zeae]|uniref:NERD domain-containing protein n=1 Tax=Mesobacillus zeae TaxID=1917180 RepID=A0A398B8W5_9BACI|nr:nuclease-related domain-containing protein [Mesobacillus zeae]RID86312.1 hypothetical protein D1970_07240 [Mesobacillus zeae]
MIAKEREMPLRLQKLEALDRRLPHSNPMKAVVTEAYRKRKSGYYGEVALDKHMDTYLAHQYTILRNIRLPVRDSFFQIDTLLLSPAFILVIEVKNHSGNIALDPKYNQMTHTYQQNTAINYNDPLLQVKLQQSLLKEWLQNHSKLSLPLDHLVIFTNPAVHIETSSPAYYSRVCRLNQFLDKITYIEKSYSKPTATSKEIKSLAKIIAKRHCPESEIDILNYYNLSEDNILKGVHCTECGNFHMKRVAGIWCCPACKNRTKDAHFQVISDYFLLINSNLSNKCLREFLCLSSPSTTLRVIHSMDFVVVGKNKGRRYQQRNNK